MSKKVIAGINEKENAKKQLLTRQLFIRDDDKTMVSVTDRAVVCGMTFPVMIEYRLWSINDTEGDIERRWLSELLMICRRFYQPGVAIISFTFDFHRESFRRQPIRCEMQHDQQGYPYLFIELYRCHPVSSLH